MPTLNQLIRYGREAEKQIGTTALVVIYLVWKIGRGIAAALLAAFVAGAAWAIPYLASFCFFLGSYWAFIYLFIYFEYNWSISSKTIKSLKKTFHLTKEERLFLFKLNYILASFVIFVFIYQGLNPQISKGDLINPLQVVAQVSCFLYNSFYKKEKAREKHLLSLIFFLSILSTLYFQDRIDWEILSVLMLPFLLLILFVPADYVFFSFFFGYFMDQIMAKWGFYLAFQQAVYCLLSFFLENEEEESRAHLKRRIFSFFLLMLFQITWGFFYFHDYYLDAPVKLAVLSSGACIVFISLKRRSERAFKRAFASYFLISLVVGIIADGESTIICGMSDTLIVFLLVHFWIILGYFCFKRSIPRNRQPFLPFFFCGIFLLMGSITQLPWLEMWLEGIDLLLLLLGIYSLIDEGDENPDHILARS